MTDSSVSPPEIHAQRAARAPPTASRTPGVQLHVGDFVYRTYHANQAPVVVRKVLSLELVRTMDPQTMSSRMDHIRNLRLILGGRMRMTVTKSSEVLGYIDD